MYNFYLNATLQAYMCVSWIGASADSGVSCNYINLHTKPILQDRHHHTIPIKSNEIIEHFLMRSPFIRSRPQMYCKLARAPTSLGVSLRCQKVLRPILRHHYYMYFWTSFVLCLSKLVQVFKRPIYYYVKAPKCVFRYQF